MDYGGAFTYMFASQAWAKKLILGAVMFLIPILGPIVVMGWALDILRNLTQQQLDPLPDWTGDNFSRWLGRGLGLSVTMLTFMLPVIVVMGVLFACSALTGTLLTGDMAVVNYVLLACISCVGFILYVVILLSAQVVLVRYASTDQIDVGLDYLKTFQLVTTNIVPLLIITVILFIWGIVSALLSTLTLGLFALVVPIYSVLVLVHFGAQLSQLPEFAEWSR